MTLTDRHTHTEKIMGQIDEIGWNKDTRNRQKMRIVRHTHTHTTDSSCLTLKRVGGGTQPSQMDSSLRGSQPSSTPIHPHTGINPRGERLSRATINPHTARFTLRRHPPSALSSGFLSRPADGVICSLLFFY